ncbi:MAG: transcription factor E [Candidatus Methanomethylicota archaeon]|uniref:Transcription factor E n=1 Tax=Thermoproteota archaeon TaxID=2056631 RepID=A0A497ETQ9_9CREN|nr:MAG: transcription factor E [Candidatus Verstraetearchaeota archaeon]
MTLSEEMRAVIQEIAGDEAVAVVEALASLEEALDEQLVDKTGIKLHNVRKVLYRLFEHNIVSYRRVRDKEAGWFKYYWRLNRTSLAILIKMKKRAVLSKLKERLNYEKEHMFFTCSRGCPLRITFEEATELNFTCPKCGGPLQHQDNSKIIRVLERKISEIEQDLAQS